jgi:prolipoprotein diacylglyceryltransferase
MALFIVGFVLWIVMLIDCVKREFPKENDKMVWILVLALTNWIGGFIYYFVIYRKQKSDHVIPQ